MAENGSPPRRSDQPYARCGQCSSGSASRSTCRWDYSTFHDYWVQQGCHGNYQCRRDLLRAIFEPVHAKLFAAQDRAVEASVAFPVSPRGATGWRQVDSEVEAIRRRFGGCPRVGGRS